MSDQSPRTFLVEYLGTFTVPGNDEFPRQEDGSFSDGEGQQAFRDLMGGR